MIPGDCPPQHCLLIVVDMKTHFNRVKTAISLSGPFRSSCRRPPRESSTDCSHRCAMCKFCGFYLVLDGGGGADTPSADLEESAMEELLDTWFLF
jgi:hypothetical protein